MPVTTRSGAAPTTRGERHSGDSNDSGHGRDSSDGSDSNESIPAQHSRRRPQPQGPVTLSVRPRQKAEPEQHFAKNRKRPSDATAEQSHRKHPKREADARQMRRAQSDGEDAGVDAALHATAARPRRRNEGSVPTTRQPQPQNQMIAKKTATRGRDIRVRRLRRNVQSVEILGNLGLRATPVQTGAAYSTPGTPEPRDGHAGGSTNGDGSDPAGSPELQSSATRRRTRNIPSDIYDVPEDDDNELSDLAAERLSKAGKNVISTQPWPNQAPEGHSRLEESQDSKSDSGPSASSDEDWEGLGDLDVDDSDEEQLPNHEIVVRPYVEREHLVSINCRQVNNLLDIMGKEGWVGRSRWIAELDAARARTRLGGSIFAHLDAIGDVLEDVPSALDLKAQSEILSKNQRLLGKVMAKLDKTLTTMERWATDMALREKNKATEKRAQAFGSDLLTLAIPMAVLVLRITFSLGVTRPDSLSSVAVPSDGRFTWTTIQYLMVISGWLSRLEALSKPYWGKPASGPAGDPETMQENQAKFAALLQKWRHHLRQQVDEANAELDRARELREKQARDRRIREQKARGQEQQWAQEQVSHDAWMRSFGVVTAQARPMAAKFQQALARRPVPPTYPVPPRLSVESNSRSSDYTTARPTPSSSIPAQLPPAPMSILSSSPEPEFESGLEEEGHPWDEEETEWFLAELKRPNRSRGYLDVCADALNRSLEEVVAYKERLEREGYYRSPGPSSPR
ncbi:uncharacterized protein C8A04DRAFT_26953 [Dichotomopilus funicola]|uniref:Uncharacterized protein n=1 Tax=Dichotomopilus funicola TaxID=1934379 RepID=A0AAN6V5E0_9PEZI|nr:hypothetical protein C8A04DRAFT_26953 [Dichotomopilus funicola]